MQRLTLFFLSAVLAAVVAEGEYYVPRAYYTIDAEGHASAPVPLRRLRRSYNPYNPGASANANAETNAWGGGSASANANANARATGYGSGSGAPGGWGLGGSYGSGKPLGSGQTRRQFGAIQGASHSVSVGASAGMDSSGNGYYDQYTSVDG